MDIKAIKTEQDYNQALKRLKKIFHAKIDTPEGDKAEVLSILIEKYEDEHYPIGMPDPFEAINFAWNNGNETKRLSRSNWIYQSCK